MFLVQIATALAIGTYVVVSKDAGHERLDADPRESLRPQHSADHLLDRAKTPTPGISIGIGTTLDTSSVP